MSLSWGKYDCFDKNKEGGKLGIYTNTFQQLYENTRWPPNLCYKMIRKFKILIGFRAILSGASFSISQMVMEWENSVILVFLNPPNLHD